MKAARRELGALSHSARRLAALALLVSLIALFAGACASSGRALPPGVFPPLSAEERSAAAQAPPSEQMALGMRLITGEGVARDPVEGLRWLRRAAEAGHAPAQARLGSLYYRGEHVPGDYSLAALWYERAAAQGDPEGMGGLGVLYAQGEGVAQDLVAAHAWLSLAAARGNDFSRRVLEEDVLPRLDDEERAEARARASAWEPGRSEL